MLTESPMLYIMQTSPLCKATAPLKKNFYQISFCLPSLDSELLEDKHGVLFISSQDKEMLKSPLLNDSMNTLMH